MGRFPPTTKLQAFESLSDEASFHKKVYIHPVKYCYKDYYLTARRSLCSEQ